MMPLHNRYFLMRHGESEANVADLIVSNPETGCKSFGLSPLGKSQAAESAAASGLDGETVIVSSDFLRTRETAQIAAETLGITSPVELEPRLRERFFGSLNGSSGDRYREVWRQDSIDDAHTTFEAESPRTLAARLAKALSTLEHRYSNQTLLLVSHGDTLRFLQLVAAGRPLTEHMEVALFKPAEIRALENMPPATG